MLILIANFRLLHDVFIHLSTYYLYTCFTDRECPEPEQIPFGTVTVTGRLFGDRVTYSCQHGYHVVGLQSRTCQADGQWARTAPSCKQNSKY